MVSFGQVKNKTYQLLETGEYVVTLQDIGEIAGDYGDRLQWDFLIAPKDAPTEYISNANGDARVLRFWTDTEITLGSKQHDWMQALTGRTFAVGATLPDGDELLNKRMLMYLTHYTPKKGKNAGVPKEDIVMGSAKPFRLPGTKANGAAQTATPIKDDERAALLAETRKQIRRALLADVESAESWKAVNLDEMTTDELRDGLQTIKDAIQAAQED